MLLTSSHNLAQQIPEVEEILWLFLVICIIMYIILLTVLVFNYTKFILNKSSWCKNTFRAISSVK